MSTAELYLDLLKRALTNVIYEDPGDGPRPALHVFDPDRRLNGLDWPRQAHTMVGRRRLDNLQWCLETAITEGVPGDFVETGVWRGGACILARGVFRAHGITDRLVWVADSFQGIPEVSEGHAADVTMRLHDFNQWLAVGETEVRDNFRRYDLLDDQVRFLPGWFRDTLPAAPIDRLAVLRLDGDLYESTTDALDHLYPKLSVGGFAIVDDYSIPACRQAVHDFRDRTGITDPIRDVDGSGVYWRRSALPENPSVRSTT